MLLNPCLVYNAQALFNAPAGSDPVALDMGSMGKGQIWVNGHHIGRYWSYKAYSGRCRRCSYAGTYREDQCMSNCGDLSQRWYVQLRPWHTGMQLGKRGYGTSLFPDGEHT